MRLQKSPPYLHTWGARQFCGGSVQADEPYKLACRQFFRSPESPSTLLNQLFAPVGNTIAGFSVQRRWKVVHDLWVSIECGEWL